MTNTMSDPRRLSLPVRLALRDLKAGLSGFRIFIACIVLGATAIVGVGSTSRSLVDSIGREGRRILGGDLSFSTVLRELTSQERTWLQARGALSEIATLRVMARKASGQAVLVEIKAVDPSYPNVGTVQIEPATPEIQNGLASQSGAFGLYSDESLQIRMDLKPGDELMIGDSRFIWRGVLKSEPDKLAGGMALGPRVMISTQALRSSGLIQPGSLVRWTYRLQVQAADGGSGRLIASNEQVQAIVRESETAFPEAGWRVGTRDRISPNFSRNLERFTQFLTLVGLTALIIGGIGIANAVRGFVNKKRTDFAILKALGASGSYVFSLAMTEVLLAALIGIAIGVSLGIALPFGIAAIFGAIIPLPFTPAIFPTEIAAGVVYGLLAAIAFSAGPLGRLHDTRVSQLFRHDLEHADGRLRLRYRLTIAASGLCFLGMIFLTATDLRAATIYLLAAGVILIFLQGVGLAFVRLARAAPRFGGSEMRLALSNLGRPGALTRPVIASVGLGLSLFVVLSTIDENIREPLSQGVPGQTPTFFFTDIRANQGDAFSRFIQDKAPGAKIEMVPMLRGRLVALNGEGVKSLRARENVAWVLEGDRGITFANEVPEGSKLLRGEWWDASYKGEPLVSVEAEVAEGLGLKIGDTVTLNVFGRNISGRIHNLREVNWRNFGINFVFVFNPAAFAGAPYSWLATATYPGAATAVDENAVVTSVTEAFPGVSTVRLKETLDAVAGIARQLGMAIRSATIIALFASVLVLAGALSAGQSARIYDLVVLKVLGATRGRLVLALAIEFLTLAAITSFCAMVIGSLTAKIILTRVLVVETFVFDAAGALQTTLLAVAIVVVLGLVGTWTALGRRPARELRNL